MFHLELKESSAGKLETIRYVCSSPIPLHPYREVCKKKKITADWSDFGNCFRTDPVASKRDLEDPHGTSKEYELHTSPQKTIGSHFTCKVLRLNRGWCGVRGCYESRDKRAFWFRLSNQFAYIRSPWRHSQYTSMYPYGRWKGWGRVCMILWPPAPWSNYASRSNLCATFVWALQQLQIKV